MILHGTDHRVSVGVRITVAAEMPTGIISADVPGDMAGTFFAVVRVRWKNHILANSIFKNLLRHAAGAIGTDRGQIRIFPTNIAALIAIPPYTIFLFIPACRCTYFASRLSP